LQSNNKVALGSKAGALEGSLDIGFKTTAPQNMIFHLTSADFTTTAGLPNSNVSFTPLRLEHRFEGPHGPTVIFLHNSDERKPKRASKPDNRVTKRNMQLVFSTVRDAQVSFMGNTFRYV
jgi:hypothetical protein